MGVSTLYTGTLYVVGLSTKRKPLQPQIFIWVAFHNSYSFLLVKARACLCHEYLTGLIQQIRQLSTVPTERYRTEKRETAQSTAQESHRGGKRENGMFVGVSQVVGLHCLCKLMEPWRNVTIALSIQLWVMVFSTVVLDQC